MLEKVADVSKCPKNPRVPFCISGGALELTCCVCGTTYMFSPTSRIAVNEFAAATQQLLETHRVCGNVKRAKGTGRRATSR
jgi:hypothetical protein